jgi:hypothetical protein
MHTVTLLLHTLSKLLLHTLSTLLLGSTHTKYIALHEHCSLLYSCCSRIYHRNISIKILFEMTLDLQ